MQNNTNKIAKFPNIYISKQGQNLMQNGEGEQEITENKTNKKQTLLNQQMHSINTTKKKY